ncbi:MAG TPA: PPA1309 family protein [Microlunatus sp.]
MSEQNPEPTTDRPAADLPGEDEPTPRHGVRPEDAISAGGETILDDSDALVAALLELERHVGQDGWDQAPRLFALVRTDAVIAAEPEMAEQLGLRGSAEGGHPDALTAIEQDHFEPTADLLEDLSSIVWPEAVQGCALSLVSSFLPADAEVDIPDDPELAAEYVAGHELQQEMRVLVGVDRADHRHGVARLRSQPDELLGAPDLVPGLTEALAHTLAEPEDPIVADQE